MISDSHRFIYIHTPKTAGTSVRKILSPYCTNLLNDHGIPDEHFHVAHYDQFPQYRDYLRFGTVRNIYARMCSFAFYRFNTCDEIGLRWMINHFMKEEYSIYRPATKFFRPDDGMVIRQSHLQEDFNLVCDEVGIPHETLPFLNTKMHMHYSQYFTPRMRNLVDWAYAEEIETYGWEFYTG